MTHAPYLNEALGDYFCVECGDFWPCLPQREVPAAVVVVPNCGCGHAGWRHVSEKARCRKPGCGCLSFRPKGAAA